MEVTGSVLPMLPDEPPPPPPSPCCTGPSLADYLVAYGIGGVVGVGILYTISRM